MTQNSISAAVIACTLFAAAAWAQGSEPEAAFAALASAKSLKCTFGKGTQATWKAGRLHLAEATFGEAIQFDAINPRAGSARIIGNVGAGDVRIFATTVGLTFVEQAPLGNVYFTTVFADQAPSTREFLAVTSRHFVSLGQEVAPSQYHGTCKVWQ